MVNIYFLIILFSDNISVGLFESKEEKEKRIEREKNEKAKLEAIAKTVKVLHT